MYAILVSDMLRKKPETIAAELREAREEARATHGILRLEEEREIDSKGRRKKIKFWLIVFAFFAVLLIIFNLIR